MKTNSELQTDVQNTIKWKQTMHTAEIGATAKDGIVILSGIVDSYSKKLNAQNIVKRVKAVAEDIIIDYYYSFKKNDPEIAKEVVDVWKYNWEIPEDRIQVKADWVKLEVNVPWKFQKKDEVPGYPLYPKDDDIYKKDKEETDLNPEDISKVKTPNEKPGTRNEKGFEDDKLGEDLDVPGSELDDQQESVGSEDEENNYYSLGGDAHNNLDEGKDKKN